MVPFMYVGLRSIATNLLQLIVKSEMLEKCKTAKQLGEINLDEKGNLLPTNKVELGFRVHGLLSKLNKRDIITIDETRKIKKEAQSFVVRTLKNIFDRSPYTCEFVRYCADLNPVVVVSCKQKSFQKHFKLLFNELMKLNILSPSQCDAVVMDFTSFYSNEFKKFRMEFEEFKEESDRSDNFFFQKVNFQNYETLSFVVKLVFTLSHGQVYVER